MLTDANLQMTFNNIVLPFVRQYEEIRWFADPKVAATKEAPADPSQQGWTHLLAQATNTDAPFIVLPKDGGKYVELERTLSSLVFCTWIREGTTEAYNKLTGIQKPGEKLTRESYDALSAFANQVLKDGNGVRALEAMLVFSDAGKTPTAREKAASENVSQADHDDFVEALFNLPKPAIGKVLPSFANLSAPIQDLLISVSHAMPIHLGHVLHEEGGSRMFQAFYDAIQAGRVTEELFEFAYLMQVCDVAAAASQVNIRGSLSLTEDTYIGYQLVAQTLRSMIKDKLTPDAALKKYTQLRADRMHAVLKDPQDEVLVRLACWLRLYQPSDYVLLQNAFQKLEKDQQELLLKWFKSDGGFNLWNRNPTYGTTTILNLAKFGDVTENKQLKVDRALEGAVCLAKFFDYYQVQMRTNANPTNLNGMAGRTASNPELFKPVTFKPADFKPNASNEVNYAGELPTASGSKPGDALLTQKKKEEDAQNNLRKTDNNSATLQESEKNAI